MDSGQLMWTAGTGDTERKPGFSLGSIWFSYLPVTPVTLILALPVAGGSSVGLNGNAYWGWENITFFVVKILFNKDKDS